MDHLFDDLVEMQAQNEVVRPTIDEWSKILELRMRSLQLWQSVDFYQALLKFVIEYLHTTRTLLKKVVDENHALTQRVQSLARGQRVPWSNFSSSHMPSSSASNAQPDAPQTRPEPVLATPKAAPSLAALVTPPVPSSYASVRNDGDDELPELHEGGTSEGSEASLSFGVSVEAGGREADPGCGRGRGREARPPRILSTDCTTLIVRNVPSRYTVESLEKEWPNNGTYNLIYVPPHETPWGSGSKKRPLGCLFINFESHKFATEFFEKWHRKKLRYHGRTKPLDITEAEVQGLGSNLKRFKARTRKNPSEDRALPTVYKDGDRVDIREMMQELFGPSSSAGPAVAASSVASATGGQAQVHGKGKGKGSLGGSGCGKRAETGASSSKGAAMLAAQGLGMASRRLTQQAPATS